MRFRNVVDHVCLNLEVFSDVYALLQWMSCSFPDMDAL